MNPGFVIGGGTIAYCVLTYMCVCVQAEHPVIVELNGGL